MGGGLAGQNVTLTEVVFKIHFKPFCVILGEKWGGYKFYNVLTFLGGKKFFFLQSCPSQTQSDAIRRDVTNVNNNNNK